MSIPTLTIFPPVSLPNFLDPGISLVNSEKSQNVLEIAEGNSTQTTLPHFVEQNSNSESMITVSYNSSVNKRKRSLQTEVNDNSEAEFKRSEVSSETETDEEFFNKTKEKIEKLVGRDKLSPGELNKKRLRKHRSKIRDQKKLTKYLIKLNEDFYSNIKKFILFNNLDVAKKIEAFPRSYRLILSKIIEANAELNQRLMEIEKEKKANNEKLYQQFPTYQLTKHTKHTNSLTPKELNRICAARYKQKVKDQKKLDDRTLNAYKDFNLIVTTTLCEENTITLLGERVNTEPKNEFCYYALKKLIMQVDALMKRNL